MKLYRARIFCQNHLVSEFSYDLLEDAKLCCEIVSKSKFVTSTMIYEDDCKSFWEKITEHFEMSCLEEKDIDPIQDDFE